MSLFHGFGYCAVLLAASSLVGCRSVQRTTASSERTIPRSDPSASNRSMDTAESDLATNAAASPIQSVAHQMDQMDPSDQMDASEKAASVTDRRGNDDLFAGANELPLDQLIAAVRARNPSLQAAHAAWSAAAERYPQALALDDPMLQSMFAPASFAANNSQPSYFLGAAQRVPWHGKRALRGQVAQWDANASGWDAGEVQLRLDVAARMAFFDYYLVQRELELNQKNHEVTQDFRSTAKSKYESNQASEQDLSLADLELAKLEEEELELRRAEQIAIARINTLIHRRPDHVLPPAPGRLEITDNLQDVGSLREVALEKRPELAAMAAKIQSEQAAVLLACKEYYPDFEFMGRYDSFWTDAQQRPQVGMNMNVPLNRGRRGAAVREAQFKVAKMMAEYAREQDNVREEVQVAYARVKASQKAVVLYERRLLPAAETNLAASRAAYIGGTVDFLSLMTARREAIAQQIGYQRALTEYHRGRADLERAVGIEINSDGTPSLELDLPASPQ